jgi:PAS domain S-box-containing protein
VTPLPETVASAKSETAALASLHARVREQAALAAIAELAMNAEAPLPVVEAACASAAELLALDAIVLLDRQGKVLAAHLEPGASAGIVPASAGSGVAGLGAALGLASAMEIPLPAPGEAPGVLAAFAREARPFSSHEVRFLEGLASVLAGAIHRHRAAAEIRDRELQLRSVFDATLDGMLIVDDEGIVLDANTAALGMLGLDRAALVGRSVHGPDEISEPKGAFSAAFSEALLHGRAQGELEFPAPAHGGARRFVEFTFVARIQPGRHLCIGRDVSERRHLQARLALADRMISVGTLASGVAHELNNPLAYVNANLAFLADRMARIAARLGGAAALPEEDDLAAQVVEALKDARSGVERMRVIVRDMKTFSRPEDAHAQPVDLSRVLDSCVNMAWSELRRRARVERQFSDVPPVLGSEAQLGQVFLNLLVNAAQAIDEGDPDGNAVTIATRVLDDGRVAVEIRDTGSGIAPTHLPRIFDPFFTTKPPGVGTGLGLSICHGVVTSLGGEIQVETGRGRGSTFRVILRAAEPNGALTPAPFLPPALPRSRILVVDDEPLVCGALRRTLDREHEVVVVGSARAALARISAGESFDLVLADLLMPEMTGMDLYRAVLRDQPAIAARMVFLTGGAFTPVAREFLDTEPVEWIEKPFELSALRAVLARRLGGAG